MPVFLAYISNAYSEYDLYANPLTDLYNDPYAGRIPGLYDGMHSSEQINAQLNVNITGAFQAGLYNRIFNLGRIPGSARCTDSQQHPGLGQQCAAAFSPRNC